MRKLSLLAALLGCFCAAQAAEPAPATQSATAASPAQNPLAGSWSGKLPGKSCVETFHYRANGTRTVTSGDEVTQADYTIPPMPSLLGFYRLLETVTVANGKKDCSGDLHEASGEPVTRFIQFSPRQDQLIVCREESLKACFGPLKRVSE